MGGERTYAFKLIVVIAWLFDRAILAVLLLLLLLYHRLRALVVAIEDTSMRM